MITGVASGAARELVDDAVTFARPIDDGPPDGAD